MQALLSRTMLALVACVMVDIAGGLGSFTFSYANGASYLSNDPVACVNCHVMREQYEGWQHASHHSVATCNDCHTPHDLVGKYATKLENGFWHSKGFTLMGFHAPEEAARILAEAIDYARQGQLALLQRGDVPNSGCVGCHPARGAPSRGNARGPAQPPEVAPRWL